MSTFAQDHNSTKHIPTPQHYRRSAVPGCRRADRLRDHFFREPRCGKENLALTKEYLNWWGLQRGVDDKRDPSSNIKAATGRQ